METVTLLSLLGICTIEDMKERQLHTLMLGFFGMMGMCLHLMFKNKDILDVLGGFGIGVVLLGISYISREKIGKGDAILVMVAGIYLGFWQNLMVLWGAAFLAGTAGLIVAVFRRDRNLELPFVPFYLLAYIISLVVNGA